MIFMWGCIRNKTLFNHETQGREGEGQTFSQSSGLQDIEYVELGLLAHHFPAVEWIVLELVVIFPLEHSHVDVVLKHDAATEVHSPFTIHHSHFGLSFHHGLDGRRETALLFQSVANTQTLGVFG